MKHKIFGVLSGFCFLVTFSSAYSLDYIDEKTAVIAKRDALALQYTDAVLDDELNIVSSLQTLLTENLFPHWYGTRWDFYGTSEVPNVGAIACGYFVTTLLRDVGFNLDRYRLAQVPSEILIKSLVTKDLIRRFSNASISSFVENIEAWGRGIYIVGLDNHVGFLSVENKKVYFIHSRYVEPEKVVREIASDSTILQGSKYRVVGKLAGIYTMGKWLRNERFSDK